ncbi:MAG: hypothetical protein R8K20_06085, partial [Gallionellaceae bacterium]
SGVAHWGIAINATSPSKTFCHHLKNPSRQIGMFPARVSLIESISATGLSMKQQALVRSWHGLRRKSF